MTDKAAAGTAAIEVAAIKVALWGKATQVKVGTDGAHMLYRKGGVVAFFDLAICDRPFGDTLDVWVAPPKLAAFAEACGVPVMQVLVFTCGTIAYRMSGQSELKTINRGGNGNDYD